MRSSLLSIRDTVASLRAALVSSSLEEIQARIPALQEAIARLEEMPRESLTPEDLQSLAGEIRTCAKLTVNGLGVARGLAGLLGATEAGYRPDGEPAPLQPGVTILARG